MGSLRLKVDVEFETCVVTFLAPLRDTVVKGAELMREDSAADPMEVLKRNDTAWALLAPLVVSAQPKDGGEPLEGKAAVAALEEDGVMGGMAAMQALAMLIFRGRRAPVLLGLD